VPTGRDPAHKAFKCYEDQKKAQALADRLNAAEMDRIGVLMGLTDIFGPLQTHNSMCPSDIRGQEAAIIAPRLLNQ
jgi:hypothetical protein